jgi:hypothetical protein
MPRALLLLRPARPNLVPALLLRSARPLLVPLRTRPSLLVLLLSACPAADPAFAPALVPTLALRCEHPDAWFEGIHAQAAHPGADPHRPGALRTQVPRAGWTQQAAQTACADVCVGLAQSGFHYSCPDTGWHIEVEPTLAPAPVPLPAHLDPDACYPDSACTAAYPAAIGVNLRRPAAPIIGGNQADHLATADGRLELRLADLRLHHPLRARAEYSAGRCDAAPCSFYLASLQLDDHGARTRAVLPLGPATLQALRIDLMQPALADYTPATGVLEFPAGALDLRIHLELTADGLESGPRELRLRNPDALRGRHIAGALELTAEVPLGDLGSARLHLDFRPDAHPPIAAFDPPTQLRAGPEGLPLPQHPDEPTSLHAAHDPDGDLHTLHWVVDGVPGAREIPQGEHDVTLWVSDTRGALDRSPIRSVHVSP